MWAGQSSILSAANLGARRSTAIACLHWALDISKSKKKNGE